MKIVPIIDLKNTVKIEQLCSETKEPVFVTKNGYGKLVVMDIECFEKMFKQSYEAIAVNDGLKDLENGKIVNGNKVKRKMKKKYNF